MIEENKNNLKNLYYENLDLFSKMVAQRGITIPPKVVGAVLSPGSKLHCE